MRDERLPSIVQRHRQPVVRQEALDDRGDLREHLADVEHRRDRVQQFLGDVEGQSLHGWYRQVCHKCALGHTCALRAHLIATRATIGHFNR